MKLEIIDLLMCPKCNPDEWDRKFQLTGDFNDTKIFDGHITCSNGHKWQVRDEILRFDHESSDDVLYDKLLIPDVNDEFYPFDLGVDDKKAYSTAMKRMIELLDDEVYAVIGSIVPLVQELGKTDKLFILFSNNELELRRAQEIAAMNNSYDSFFFVRCNRFPLNPQISLPTLSILSDVKATHQVILSDNAEGELLGRFSGKFLIYH